MTLSLQDWLTHATRRLAPDGVERIRAEIGDHYNSAVASGKTADCALRSLGDPKRANREYRRVFLTEFEAAIGPTIPKPTLNLRGMGIGLLLAVTLWYFYLPSFAWALLLFVGGLFAGGLSAASYFNYKRRAIFRKLAGKPAPAFVPKLLPGEPWLTQTEAVLLKVGECFLRGVMTSMTAGLAVGAYFLPLMFGALTALMALRFLLPFAVDFGSPTRSRWFFKAKVTLLALAVILPPFQFAIPLPLEFPPRIIPAALVLNAAIVALFLLIEWTKYRFRRKLPLEEWPKELYL